MKKLVMSLALCFLSFLFINSVKANSINSIKMDVYIEENGDAIITEVWDADLNEGTEGYRFYGNLGNSTITDFHVKDETTEYQEELYWDVNSSFDEKAYKYGINSNSDHDELCFGISNYGHHTYTLTYKITGFVAETDDSQIVYWELIPTELAKLTNNIYIKIHANQQFSDKLDIWGYGNKGGLAYVYNGYIEVSNDALKNDEYVTVLIKFDKGTFKTSNVIGNNFKHYYDMAEDGAEHYKEKSNINLFSILIFIFPIIWIVLLLVGRQSISKSKVGTKSLDFGTTGTRIKSDVPMFRDLPCNKDIYRAYWVANNYNLMKKNTDFLGAILLKWLKQDKIKIESKTVESMFKKEETTIVFNGENNELDTELENKLYKYMYEASKDGILESKEFERWCSKNYNKILNWFNKIIDYESDKLIEEKKLVETEKTILGVFKIKVYNVDPSMMNEAEQMKGLKNFFKEFENMTDKEAIEVKFWEEYLMYAQIFGVAEKVAKQFKKLYPDVITDYSYDSIIFVHDISHSGMSSAQTARSRAESYSSGGGGFSSGGGGGGSFGGGGGGGFR